MNQFERKWNSASENEPFVPLPPNTPSYAAPANAAIAQPTTVKLQWEGGPWAHKYDIYFGTTPNPPLLIANVSTAQSGAQQGDPVLDSGSVDDGNIESYTIPTLLQGGTTYYWKIVGKTMANMTATGPVWSFTTGGTEPAPAAPTGLTAIAASPTQINLTWFDTANETGYRMERSPDKTGPWVEVASLPANTTSYASTGLNPQTTYFYRVRALNTGVSLHTVNWPAQSRLLHRLHRKRTWCFGLRKHPLNRARGPSWPMERRPGAAVLRIPTRERQNAASHSQTRPTISK